MSLRHSDTEKDLRHALRFTVEAGHGVKVIPARCKDYHFIFSEERLLKTGPLFPDSKASHLFEPQVRAPARRALKAQLIRKNPIESHRDLMASRIPSRSCSNAWPASTMWPTTASPCRFFLRFGCSGRCSSKAKQESERPRWPPPSPPRSAPTSFDSSVTKAWTSATRSTNGTTPRQLLELRILEAARPLDRDDRPARTVQRCVPHQAAVASGHRPGSIAPGGPADRRNRSSRRRVRRVPARTARGVPNHDPRTGDDSRERAAARRS